MIYSLWKAKRYTVLYPLIAISSCKGSNAIIVLISGLHQKASESNASVALNLNCKITVIKIVATRF